MITTEPPAASTLPATLRRLYLGRFGFAVVWALLVALVSPRSDALLTVLLVLYPLVDAASVYVELRASGSSARSRLSERANVALSVLAAVALGWSALNSVGAVLTVWGVWAVVSGGTQLLTGIGRRRLGGQWPLIVSGALSFLVGFGFIGQGLGNATGLGPIAGYATLGGVFFLISAIRLGRTARAS
ncbi:hypothetical protein [Occultella kanbiaonis]|uniref:hypothetical protein n=1 Tax=Occultella kanbiaonis TaxID=2675754 RepID=UPI0012B84876|nr:hypothetical protein [Occultella kanbiaonis]